MVQPMKALTSRLLVISVCAVFSILSLHGCSSGSNGGVRGDGVPPLEDSQLVAWNADPWDDCVVQHNGSQGRAHREVRCMSLFDNLTLDENACDRAQKPCPIMECFCDTTKCVNESARNSHISVMSSALQCVGVAPARPTLKPIGCLTEATFSSWTGNASDETRDLSCMSCHGPESCRGGLPFFHARNFTTSDACASFCVSMGLDLSGKTASGACHCGATPLNGAVYHLDKPRDCLLLNTQTLVPENASACSVVVFRYVGNYVDHGIPPSWVEALEQDDLYIDSVVAGRLITAESLDDGSQHHSDPQPMAAQNAGPNWQRKCWPNQCSSVHPSRMFNRVSQSRPSGVKQQWNKYIMIPYVFAAGTDGNRKDAFRVAADRWRQTTCINLYESGDPNSFDLRVQGGSGGCWAYLGRGSTINLGWCNSMRHVGSMMHEIGHAVGMHHEQKRPDATRTYHGKGPHLNMKWQSIPAQWTPQWLPEAGAYVGSGYDGTGDVHAGYAPYDYGSLMHYGVKPPHETIPRGTITGNRRGLSAGDIKQVSDMYQCYKAGAGPSPSTNRPTSRPTGNYYRRVNGVGEWGGICTCPDGQRYEVGDNSNSCGSLACENGSPGSCSIFGISSRNRGMKVTCATAPRPTPSPTPPPPSCQDRHSSCTSWQRSGYCSGRWAESMKYWCPRSCGRCGGERLASNAQEPAMSIAQSPSTRTPPTMNNTFFRTMLLSSSLQQIPQLMVVTVLVNMVKCMASP